jgi:hypothetical protein
MNPYDPPQSPLQPPRPPIQRKPKLDSMAFAILILVSLGLLAGIGAMYFYFMSAGRQQSTPTRGPLAPAQAPAAVPANPILPAEDP